jgi:hypothetical protein
MHKNLKSPTEKGASFPTFRSRTGSTDRLGADLRFWNQTLICLGSMFLRMEHSLMSCCRRSEVGLGHSPYTRSSASTCSGVYRTYLPVSTCGAEAEESRLSLVAIAVATAARCRGSRGGGATACGPGRLRELPWRCGGSWWWPWC